MAIDVEVRVPADSPVEIVAKRPGRQPDQTHVETMDKAISSNHIRRKISMARLQPELIPRATTDSPALACNI